MLIIVQGFHKVFCIWECSLQRAQMRSSLLPQTQGGNGDHAGVCADAAGAEQPSAEGPGELPQQVHGRRPPAPGGSPQKELEKVRGRDSFCSILLLKK